MPHMTADDRLKAIREAEGETVKATLAPQFKVHHGMSQEYTEMHELRAPMEDKRVYGRMMGRALMMAGVAAWIAIGVLAAAEAWLGVL